MGSSSDTVGQDQGKMADQEGHQFFSDTEDHQEKAKAVPAKKAKNVTQSSAKKRYIVFVGNLPYEATKEDLETLFKHLGTLPF